jgi:hypothetical protein
MKRTKLEMKLNKRLNLVRTTICELTPTELRQVNGGTMVTFTCTDNCPCSNPYTFE